ncbi:MAG: S1C family serine protease [Suipraeoptans sp.]
MDNQYFYEAPEQNNVPNDGFNNIPPNGNVNNTPPKKKKVPGWTKAICFGAIFGLVAGLVFGGTNVIISRIAGTSITANKDADQTTTSDSATLTTSAGSTVSSDITEIAKNTMPSVVSITNMSVQQVMDFFGGTRESTSESAGSGIIIGQNEDEMLILTNNHVVEGNDTLTVSFIDEESVDAQVKGTDASRDVAVIAVDKKDIKDSTMNAIKVATIGDSTELQVGEQVIAIGNALGYGQSVTSGIISATDREVEGFDGKLIQTDAAINPGNSGGALLNANGEVIGINTVKASGEAVEGMGYAIPITDAGDIITELMNKETRTKVSESERGVIGIKGVDVTNDNAQLYDMPQGVYVSEVVSGSAADKAGIKKGDVITSMEGTKIDSMTTLQEQLQYYKAGETVKITVESAGKSGNYESNDVEVTLGSN